MAKGEECSSFPDWMLPCVVTNVKIEGVGYDDFMFPYVGGTPPKDDVVESVFVFAEWIDRELDTTRPVALARNDDESVILGFKDERDAKRFVGMFAFDHRGEGAHRRTTLR
jgi:hypothetical protein